MLLSVKERLVLLQLMPAQGDLTTLKLVRKVREALSFDEEEHERLHFVQQDGRITWDPEAEFDKDIELGPRVQRLVLDQLAELDGKRQLTDELLNVCERFGYGDDS